MRKRRRSKVRLGHVKKIVNVLNVSFIRLQTTVFVGSFKEAESVSSRSARDTRRISKLLHGPVRCPYCGKPAHTVAIDLEGEQAELHCQKCGTFETSVRELKLFRR